MLDRSFILLSKIILVLIIIFLLIGIIDYAAIAIEYFKGEKMELGNAADWFSGLCNAVMAAAAVYGVLNVPTWLLNKRREEAYAHAKSIIDTLKEIDYLYTEIQVGFLKLILTSLDDTQIKNIIEFNQTLLSKINQCYSLLGENLRYKVKLKDYDIFTQAINTFSEFNHCISSVADNYDELEKNEIINKVTSFDKDFISFRKNILNASLEDLFEFE
ncbi:hypothetical protein NMD96_12935 [Edwardsiella tarda]|uniref:hypothetical protein n=1 Tax=Edwardsiella tarda TaxID=636 RepID=UPI00351C8FA2